MMAKVKKFYYRIKSAISEQAEFKVTKLDADLEHVQTYSIYEAFDRGIVCNCPSRKRPCKHLAMLHRFQDVGMVDGDHLYDPLTDMFLKLEQI